jgi:hypothetical protein
MYIGLFFVAIGGILMIAGISSVADGKISGAFTILFGILLFWIGAKLMQRKKAYCADCGQYLGFVDIATSPCPRPGCGCNIYTTAYAGVGRTSRAR